MPWLWPSATAAFLILIHVAPVMALVRGTRPADWGAFCVGYAIASLGAVGGLHRYFAHASFRTSRVFQLLIALAGCAVGGDPISFTARHRRHHRLADTGDDVHGPHQGWFYCWFGTLVDYAMSEREMLQLAPDLAAWPELRWLHRWSFVPAFGAAAVAALVGGFTMFAIGYCLPAALIVNFGSAVNYFGHRGRRRSYPTRDRSSNSWLLALVSFGEGWHNNHHYYPAACRSGFAWWEIDVMYYELRLLAWLGLIWDLKEVPAHVRAQVRAASGRRW
ncbi:MAG: acyl-CoA desaturase [Acidobacteria bacterium]|nr:acyl-CoA desaturase [Acidobacteriota bacterium]